MAFGFVVVKFSLFVKQIEFVLGNKLKTPSQGYSATIGILLVGVGVLTIFFSFLQYRKTDKQLKSGNYMPSTMMTSVVTTVILLISLVLIVYLVRSV